MLVAVLLCLEGLEPRVCRGRFGEEEDQEIGCLVAYSHPERMGWPGWVMQNETVNLQTRMIL